MTKEEKRAKHAAYMREYNKLPVAHRIKLLRDREYREKNLAKIQAYDRTRSKLLARRAAKYVYGKNARKRRRHEMLDKVKEYLKTADAEKILGVPTYSKDQREKRPR